VALAVVAVAVATPAASPFWLGVAAVILRAEEEEGADRLKIIDLLEVNPRLLRAVDRDRSRPTGRTSIVSDLYSSSILSWRLALDSSDN